MNVADEAGLRNFKDFLLVYNQMSELCFNRCIVSLNSRSLTEEEAACSDVCVSKQMKFNQKAMAVYMVEQPKILEKKMETAQAESEAMMERLKEQGVDTSGLMQEGGNGLVDGGAIVENGVNGVPDTQDQRTESVATVSDGTESSI